jgi:predicted molibdopterin-dependent oxidoreductase YjgC
MFKRINSKQGSGRDNLMVDILFEGRNVSVPAGISIAAALLYLDAGFNRESAVSGSPRSSYCMMGVCFECLVEVDGDLSQRGCQTAVCQGMSINRQLSTSKAGYQQ